MIVHFIHNRPKPFGKVLYQLPYFFFGRVDCCHKIHRTPYSRRSKKSFNLIHHLYALYTQSLLPNAVNNHKILVIRYIYQNILSFCHFHKNRIFLGNKRSI